jgi:hypothetical protein
MAGWNRSPLGLPSLAALRAQFLPLVRATAFWSAIALPLITVPMLVTETVWESPLMLLALFALNALAFVVGHGHNQPESAGEHH